jgi:hypothetical protein
MTLAPLRPEQLPLLDLRPDPSRLRPPAKPPKIVASSAPAAQKPHAEKPAAAPPRAKPPRASPRPQPPVSYGCIRYLEPEPPLTPPETLILAPAVLGEAPEGKGLDQAKWNTSDEPEALLAHALPLIPLRHTCLLFAAIVERLWPV